MSESMQSTITEEEVILQLQKKLSEIEEGLKQPGFPIQKEMKHIFESLKKNASVAFLLDAQETARIVKLASIATSTFINAPKPKGSSRSSILKKDLTLDDI